MGIHFKFVWGYWCDNNYFVSIGFNEQKRNVMNLTINLRIPQQFIHFLKKHNYILLGILLSVISLIEFFYYYQNGLALAYNDARSHLDIGRRVVENITPGFAQLGS